MVWRNNIYKKKMKNKIKLKRMKVNTVSLTTWLSFVHHKDMLKKKSIKKSNNTLMSLMIWNHKKWMNQWWVNNHNQLKTSKIINNNSKETMKKMNKIFVIKILFKHMQKQIIMYQDQNINTISLKLKKLRFIKLYHLLICLKKILKTLTKLWRKEWMSPWWVINHKQVKSYKWTSNLKKNNNKNFEPVKSLNITW